MYHIYSLSIYVTVSQLLKAVFLTSFKSSCGCSVGEYQSYSECRDAIDKLTGAALDGHIVKLTALVSDRE